MLTLWERPNVQQHNIRSLLFVYMWTLDNFNKHMRQKSVHVIVSSPPTIIVNPQSRKLALAARVRFPCLARGYPKPILTWLHNGDQIKPDARVKIITGLVPKNMTWVENEMNSEELVFTSTNSADVGIYQCVASNEYGVNWTAAHLYINDTTNPMAPINPRCLTINSTAVWIYWEQSKHDNIYPQEPIYFKDENVEVSPQVKFERVYTVAYHPTVGGDETHVPSLENSLAIAGLVPNTDYTFYVRTFGGKSGSDPSEKIMCTTLPENVGILLSSTTEAFLSTISPDLINVIKPVNESVLQLRLINKTTVEINWKMEKPAIEFEKLIISYKKQDEISSIVKYVNFDQKRVLLFGLEPETKYDISLKLIVNGTEGEIVTQSILTANFEKGNAGISAEPLSSTSVKIKWTQSANVTSQYKIRYKELSSNTWYDAPHVFARSNSVIIYDLLPDTVYLVQVWLNNNVNNYQDEETLITSLQVRTLFETSPVVPNLFFQPLNATAVRIWWDGLRSLEYKGKLFVVTYLPFSNGLQGSNTMLVPGNKNTVDITNLEPNVKYSVTVGLKSNTVPATEGKTIYFTLSSDFVHKTQESEENLEAAGFHLTEDQLWGILIGSGIAAIFVLICLFIYVCCKRHLEKHRHQMLNRCRPISSQDEKHEMKMLPKNSNCYQAQHVNSRTSNLNLHLPLLPQNSNFSNGSIQNMNADSHCKYYDLQAKVIREESDQLLNSDSPIEETCLTLREMSEHDHGGGDSGYCDRNHSQSPQVKDYDSIRKFRKSSDVTLDDGFYENELQGTSGTSPSESNRLR